MDPPSVSQDPIEQIAEKIMQIVTMAKKMAIHLIVITFLSSIALGLDNPFQVRLCASKQTVVDFIA